MAERHRHCIGTLARLRKNVSPVRPPAVASVIRRFTYQNRPVVDELDAPRLPKRLHPLGYVNRPCVAVNKKYTYQRLAFATLQHNNVAYVTSGGKSANDRCDRTTK